MPHPANRIGLFASLLSTSEFAFDAHHFCARLPLSASRKGQSSACRSYRTGDYGGAPTAFQGLAGCPASEQASRRFFRPVSAPSRPSDLMPGRSAQCFHQSNRKENCREEHHDQTRDAGGSAGCCHRSRRCGIGLLQWRNVLRQLLLPPPTQVARREAGAYSASASSFRRSLPAILLTRRRAFDLSVSRAHAPLRCFNGASGSKPPSGRIT